MPTPGLRLVLIAFPVLSAAVATNLFLMQPRAGRLATVTLAAPAPAAPRAGSAGAVVPPAARGEVKAAPQTVALSPADAADTVRAIRRELSARGYEAGTGDSAPDLVTRAAILAWEYDNGLALTAEPSQHLLKTILLRDAAGRPAAGRKPAAEPPGPQAVEVIRYVQQSLGRLGYTSAKPDGRLGADTARAIREFEIDQSLSETGRISGGLVARLARLTGKSRVATGR